MSQVQGAMSAASLIQWQYLQAFRLADTSSASQSSAGTAPAKAFDPFAGLGSATAPSSGSASGSGGPCSPFGLDMMSALIAAQEQQSSGTATGGLSKHQQKVFSELDTDGNGSISKAELDTDFGIEDKPLADYVMKKLDSDGDGAVSQNEFGAGTRRGGRRHHVHAAQDQLQALMLAMQGANSHGMSSYSSFTTTIAYANGSRGSLTNPAASVNASNLTNPYTSRERPHVSLPQPVPVQAPMTSPVQAQVTPPSGPRDSGL